MLTIPECKKYLKKFDLTDKEVKRLRNSLYCIVENIIDNHLSNVKQQAIKGQ